MLVSIITPSFNQGLFIEKTILSVKNQRFKNLEHIIFDNNSEDKTKDILKKYKKFINYTIEQDNGQSHAINKGFKKAKGDIIGWLNSDDIYHPNAVKQIVDYFNKNPNVVVCHVKDGMLDFIPRHKYFFKKYNLSFINIFKIRIIKPSKFRN